jgi:replicative DNA helicase
MRIETTILCHLLYEDEFARKVIPFLNERYFVESSERLIFKQIESFLIKYNSLPSKEALLIEVDNLTKLGETEHKSTTELIEQLNQPDKVDQQWLIDNTEKFCQEKAVYNAIMDSIHILDNKDGKNDKGSIPQILTNALSISFDNHIGHDFLNDFNERFDFYHRVEEKIPFDLDLMNKITRGGFSKKSLNIILAGTGVGKTLAMCHMAASNLMMGKNVLYITMEMAEEKIAERIDANLLNVSCEDLAVLPRDIYENKVNKIRDKTVGKMIVKEYPTASAHTGHFRHLLNELFLKMSFKPDIIYLDYLNICMSARIKPGANINSYTYIKSIAEELRGLAVEFNLPIISATQTTRSGYSSSDPGLEDTSESFGLPATADFMIALVSSEQLQDLNQIMIKQLKNRYNDPTLYRKFVVGIDRSKFRLYDVEQSAQDELIDDKPAFDKSKFGGRMKEDDSMRWSTKKIGRKDFSGFKV